MPVNRKATKKSSKQISHDYSLEIDKQIKDDPVWRQQKLSLDLADKNVRKQFIEEELSKIEGIIVQENTITCPTTEIFYKWVIVLKKLEEFDKMSPAIF
jgi:hypothetical protein